MGKDEKDAVADVRAERVLFFADAYLAARREALDELVPLAAEVEREYTALKRERGMLDNDDLLSLAYDALKNDAAVRAEFAGRFKMVMVDEFQDTAQQQVELVRLLCSPDGRELCTVGDAQQSIYRFRGADVSVFRGKKEEVAAQGGTVCDLDVNFRSHADILSYADALFEGGAANPLGRDFLHLDSCGEDRRAGARALKSPETSRRQAFLVAGGTSEERARAKAAAIAARFVRPPRRGGLRPRRDGHHHGDALQGGYLCRCCARRRHALRGLGRHVGIPPRRPRWGVVGALLDFLANPDDGERGITPLVTSPLFGFGGDGAARARHPCGCGGGHRRQPEHHGRYARLGRCHGGVRRAAARRARPRGARPRPRPCGARPRLGYRARRRERGGVALAP